MYYWRGKIRTSWRGDLGRRRNGLGGSARNNTAGLENANIVVLKRIASDLSTAIRLHKSRCVTDLIFLAAKL